jgi:hypothetical protein
MFKNFENKYNGERCFIIGSGPSLIREKLSLLKNEKIFIVNRAYKALSHGLTHYDFHVCVDKRVYEENSAEIQKNTKFPRFYNHAFLDSEQYWSGPKEKFIPIFRHENKNSILYKSLLLNIMPSNYYDGWGKTGTVVIDAILIAFFLGFKEIYILGNDLSYENNKNTHFYGGGVGERRFSSEIKSAIFLSDSLSLIVKNLNKFFELNSVKMVNLSKGYKHEGLFKTGKLEDLF